MLDLLVYPYTRSLERVPSPVFGGRRGVYEHRHVVAVVLNRSEWSAKRSRSEREADHERRSVDLYKSDLCRFPS